MRKLYALASNYLDEYLKRERQESDFMAKMAEAGNLKAYGFDDDTREASKPYQVVKGIALYEINGALQSKGNFWTRWMGTPTYDGINSAMAAMATDESVEKVLISMNTPGGSVSGLSDVSESWKRLNAIKPVNVHTSGALASAGVWLASNSSKIYASPVAEVGSIGVIMQHVSRERQLEADGLKVTTIKSAPFKYVGDPTHDLTEAEQAHLQVKVMENDALFKRHLKSTRPGVSDKAFTGATFVASQAKSLGLVDEVLTYTEVFEKLSAGSNNKPYGDTSMKKRYVTAEMAEAAILAGAAPDTFEILAQADYDAHILAQKAEGEKKSETPAPGTEGEKKAEELPAEPNEALVALQAEFDTLKASAEILTTEKSALEAKIATLEASVAEDVKPFRDIIEARATQMRTGLGMASVDLSGFSAQSVLAEYNAVDVQFKNSFKAGGIVAPKVGAGSDAVKTAMSAGDKARLNAAF